MTLTKTEKYWNKVEKTSKDIIANLLEKNLPLTLTSKNFDLERDTDYRTLLREDIPNYYEENNEELPECEIVAQEVALWYLRITIKSIISDLSEYACYDEVHFTNLTD